MNYLAITIGPIYKTIKQARKTREIWAASFIFSLMMKEILKALKARDKVAEILNPDVSDIQSNKTYHGAGVYPDRCQVLLNGEFLSDDEINALREEVYSNLPGDFSDCKDYFHIYVVQGNYSELPTDPNGVIIHRLNKLLANMELQQKFSQSGGVNIIEKLGRKSIFKALKKKGMAEEDPVYIKGQERLPSLLEICTRELQEESFYNKIVRDPIFKALVNEEMEIDPNDDILKNLKSEVGKENFKTRFKYFAIVQSDGDSIGERITGVGNEVEGMQKLSKDLMSFSKEAAEMITAFQAIPVYIGGDDLLFVAPLVSSQKIVEKDKKTEEEIERNKTLFDLIAELDKEFGSHLSGGTLSYGVSIGFYKYPMGQILESSYELLFEKAKKAIIKTNEKNALAFEVRKHSGKPFGAIMHKGTRSFEHFMSMFKTYHNLEETFLTGIMRTLNDQRFLLTAALKSGSTKHFFEHNFNEATHKENNKFLNDVEEFSVKVFNDFQNLKSKNVWCDYFENKEDLSDDNIIAHTIFSCLRLIQFLNSKDHE